MHSFETNLAFLSSIVKSFLNSGLNTWWWKTLRLILCIYFNFSLFCYQETFWRIPAKISASQLRSAAAALSPREEDPKGDEEQNGSTSPTGESQEEEEVSSEQRAQALRALLLTRKRKHHNSEHAGMCGSFMLLCVLCQMTVVNYSFGHVGKC